MKLTTQRLKKLIQEQMSEMMEPSEHDVYGTDEEYAGQDLAIVDHKGKKLGLKIEPDGRVEVFFVHPLAGIPHHVGYASSTQELIQLLNTSQ